MREAIGTRGAAERRRLAAGMFVAFEHERGEQVLINTDHVVMVVGHNDMSSLMLDNNETIPVRGTLQDILRRLQRAAVGGTTDAV
jgi:hypothetical protein